MFIESPQDMQDKMRIRKIKRYSSGIFKAVQRLLPQLDPEAELPSENYFQTILKSGCTHLFVVELGNKEIAGILTLTTYNIPTGTKFLIEDVVIDESHRGKGYGKEVMLHAMRYAESMGAKAIDLTSRPFRTEANQLYLKLGFVIRETNVYRYIVK
jgi:ribosomal protein S18 acetylase RimI-like enzyme